VIACSDPSPDLASRPAPAATTPTAAAVALGAAPIAVDARGVPRLLRGHGLPPAPAATALASARTHLARLAPAWGIRGALADLDGVGEIEVPGGRIARLAQRLDGLPIDRGELRVLVGSGGELRGASGTAYGTDTPRTAATFAGDDAGAIARAVAHTRGAAFAPGALATRWTRSDGTRVVGGTHDGVVVELARATRAWYPVDGGRALIAAWIVEAYTSPAGSTAGELHRTVLAGDGGRVLAHRSLTADAAFSYRVFAETTGDLRPLDGPIADATPHPTGAPDGSFPPYIAPSLVTVEGLNHPMGSATPDPWLAAAATETQGNNVDAYADLTAPQGLSAGDFRATTTGALAFDRTYDTALEPLASQPQQMAAITSLFYSINWLHDFWYDAGFTEVAGNGQASNYGRGGEEGDALLAEAQDNANGGSRNNANMSTPSDGLPPRMQVFLWSGKQERALTLTPQNRTPATATAAFGPKNFDLTGAIVLGDDGTAPANDGCTAITNAVAGNVVLVDRGGCTFKTKALNIQNAGGVGMLLANNQASTTAPAMGEDSNITTAITIASMSVTLDEGTSLKAELVAGPSSARLFRQTGVELDGAVDSTLVAHEFGHYVHHRLSECGTKMCGAMSEGWGDFLALMLLARAGDNLDGAYPFSIYTTQSFTGDPGYYGIRRAPYSANPAINALSFRHMADGEGTPTAHPFLASGPNSEVHNAGEVWAAALWEGYVALQKAGTSFEDVRAKMAKYVVSGLLMAPPDASPLETRDAILTAAAASSMADHDTLAAAFARRGFGSCAIAPGPASTDFAGIVESTQISGFAVAEAHTGAPVTSCDSDAVLDSGETMKITVPITNRGHAALTNITATLTSTTEGITILSEPVQLASLAPAASVQLTAEIRLERSVATPAVGDFALAIAATGGCEDTTTVPFAIRLDVDDVPQRASTDTFDTAASVWTLAGDGAAELWSVVRATALDGEWHGADAGFKTDTALVSPVVTVGEGPLTIQLAHRHEFEASAEGELFDGGVIEYSTDLGATWNDIATLVQPGYTGMLVADNTLGARMAFAGKNPSHPQPDTVTLDLGTQLAGAQLQLRFRIGTDTGVGGPGWEIDDVAFTGITGTPFPSQVADATDCAAQPDPDPDPPEDTGCCDAGPLGASNLAGAFVVLGLVLRRKRARRAR